MSRKFMHIIATTLTSLAAVASAAFMSSCVHEFPEKGEARKLVLHISHDTDWTYHDMTITRGDIPAPAIDGFNPGARYHIRVYPKGSQDVLIQETQFVSDDLTRGDFTMTLQVPPGSYDLYVWSDYADLGTKNSYFFNSGNFGAIVYSEPYNGNNELRDAFRGAVSFDIDSNIDANYYEEVWVQLERPLARYEFIATDLEKFIEDETTRTEGAQQAATKASPDDPTRGLPLDQYRVKMIYAAYMPSKFNNFTDRPIDSSVGQTYSAKIVRLNDKEARLGFDYVMVNGRESSVKVQLEVYDPKDEPVARISPIDVPTKRSMNTTVRGKFLTSKVSGGVGINPDFNGEFNVPIN